MLRDTLHDVIGPALSRLPARMDSLEARVLLLAVGLQESRMTYRRQLGGPARGLWQFEVGTPETRGGVTGVLLHPASRNYLVSICTARELRPEAHAIYEQLEHDDVLAAIVARLLLWTDPAPLPAVTDADAAWAYYLRTWRPGKPHPETWHMLHARARAAVEAVSVPTLSPTVSET